LYLEHGGEVSFHHSFVLLDPLKRRQADPGGAGERTLAPAQQCPRRPDLRGIPHRFTAFPIRFRLTTTLAEDSVGRPKTGAAWWQRRAFIGGSDARIILGNDEAGLVRLWREKRGEVDPEDLSGNLIVQLGKVTEDFNRGWYERNTGRTVRDVQRLVKHSAIPWMAATLDGIVEGTGAVFEAKFMLPWSFSEETAAEKYMAQVQHNMWA